LPNLEGGARSRMSTIEITPRSLVWLSTTTRRRLFQRLRHRVDGPRCNRTRRAVSLRQLGVCSQLHSGGAQMSRYFTVTSTPGRNRSRPRSFISCCRHVTLRPAQQGHRQNHSHLVKQASSNTGSPLLGQFPNQLYGALCVQRHRLRNASQHDSVKAAPAV
jgi:hypothetical protein